MIRKNTRYDTPAAPVAPANEGQFKPHGKVYVVIDSASRCTPKREVARVSTLAAAKKEARDDCGRSLKWKEWTGQDGSVSWISDDNYDIRLA